MQLISEINVEIREKDDLLISQEEEKMKKICAPLRCENEKYSKNVRRNKKRFEKGQGWSLKNNILFFLF